MEDMKQESEKLTRSQKLRQKLRCLGNSGAWHLSFTWHLSVISYK